MKEVALTGFIMVGLLLSVWYMPDIIKLWEYQAKRRRVKRHQRGKNW